MMGNARCRCRMEVMVVGMSMCVSEWGIAF